MTTGKPASKGPNILGALMDFLILLLLVGGAGLGGYYWGTIQRMAPVKAVPAGTPGAITETTEPNRSKQETVSETGKPKDPPATTETPKSTEAAATTAEKPSSSTRQGPKKFWIASSGADYIGYQITVSVNGTPVDSFFGPGKTVDVTRYVKPGENSIDFDAKDMGKSYNKHKGDEKAVLTLQLVSGPFISENYSKSDVLNTYSRNAAEKEDFKSSETFVKD